MGFSQVLFELVEKGVVDAIASTVQDISEFGSLVHHCRILLRVTSGFKICYVKQQANVVAHTKEKKLDISADISSKYRISAGTDTILPTERNRPQIGKIVDISGKYRKFSIFRRNIESISHARMY